MTTLAPTPQAARLKLAVWRYPARRAALRLVGRVRDRIAPLAV